MQRCNTRCNRVRAARDGLARHGNAARGIGREIGRGFGRGFGRRRACLCLCVRRPLELDRHVDRSCPGLRDAARRTTVRESVRRACARWRRAGWGVGVGGDLVPGGWAHACATWRAPVTIDIARPETSSVQSRVRAGGGRARAGTRARWQTSALGLARTKGDGSHLNAHGRRAARQQSGVRRQHGLGARAH